MKHSADLSLTASGRSPVRNSTAREKSNANADVQVRPVNLARNKSSKMRLGSAPRTDRAPGPKPVLDRDPSDDIWRKIGIPKSRDIRRLAPASLPRNKRFETLSDVEDRKRKLIEALENLEPELAGAYDNCTPEAPCSIPGCPFCSRRNRGYRFSETMRINELPFPGPRFYVTVYLATITEGELAHTRIFDAHKKIRKRMERLGFRGVLVGGTEAAWIAKRRVWILHLHILSIGVSSAEWDRLRTTMDDTDGAIPIKVERLKDAVRALSYMQKWVTYFRPRRRFGHKPSQPVPLKPQQVAELCRWWSCHRFKDFMFLYGARRRVGRIEPEDYVPEVGTVGMRETPRVLLSRTFTVESIYRGRTIRLTVRDEIAIADQISESRSEMNYPTEFLPPIPTRPTKHTNARAT